MPKHIAVYLRVSSKRQDTASQKPDVDRWIAAHADESVKTYSDKYTGRTMKRSGWQKLWAQAEAGKVSTIVVWRLDRLGRTASGLTKLFDDMISRKINLVSIKDGLDLSTPAGRLMANMLASVAQFETEIRAERSMAGQAVARAAGKTWGGSEKGRLLKVTPDQVEAIKAMELEGKSKTSIARITQLSRPTIYRVLREH